MTKRVIRLPQVIEKVGLQKSAIYALEQEGKFPRRIQLVEGRKGASGWLEEEVDRWIEERVAARNTKRQGRVREEAMA